MDNTKKNQITFNPIDLKTPPYKLEVVHLTGPISV